MDYGYILFNTLIYGIVGFIIASYTSHYKYLNFAIGAFMIFLGYIIENIYSHGFSLNILCISLFLVIFYFSINIVVFKFTTIKQRELFGFVFTLAVSILLGNLNSYLFGPNSIGIQNYSQDTMEILITIIVINVIIFYFFKIAFIGKVFRGIQENAKSLSTLGININRLLHLWSIFLFILAILCSYYLLINTSLKQSDAMFYLIKGVGIMILVGTSKIEYIFLGTLLYVLVEYLLFIKLGAPISYKETLILGIILLVLIFKPTGIFSISKRKI